MIFRSFFTRNHNVIAVCLASARHIASSAFALIGVVLAISSCAGPLPPSPLASRGEPSPATASEPGISASPVSQDRCEWPPPGEDTDQAKALYQRALEAADHKDYESALLLSKASYRMKHYPGTLVGEAAALYGLGRLEEASGACQEAMAWIEDLCKCYQDGRDIDYVRHGYATEDEAICVAILGPTGAQQVQHCR